MNDGVCDGVGDDEDGGEDDDEDGGRVVGKLE